MLHAAGIACDCLVSSHAGHAVNALASKDLSPYVAILVVGGDGTVHEVLQVCCSDDVAQGFICTTGHANIGVIKYADQPDLSLMSSFHGHSLFGQRPSPHCP